MLTLKELFSAIFRINPKTAGSLHGRGRIAHFRKSGPGRRHAGVSNPPGSKLAQKVKGRE